MKEHDSTLQSGWRLLAEENGTSLDWIVFVVVGVVGVLGVLGVVGSRSEAFMLTKHYPSTEDESTGTMPVRWRLPRALDDTQ